jgi:hypothetical protein
LEFFLGLENGIDCKPRRLSQRNLVKNRNHKQPELGESESEATVAVRKAYTQSEAR